MKATFSRTEFGTPVVSIYGGRRRVYLDQVSALECVDHGATFHGELESGLKFEIIGGVKAGGSPRDWFLTLDREDPEQHPIRCNSFKEALLLIDNA